jgi:hypothetical protein
VREPEIVSSSVVEEEDHFVSVKTSKDKDMQIVPFKPNTLNLPVPS